MGPVMHCQRMSHVCGAGGWGGCRGQELPPWHTGSPSSGILMMAGQESLRQRKLSQATSCDWPARISFMAWAGPQIWKPQHYEAAHGKVFLTTLSLSPLLLPRMTWNRKHTICCAWSQAEGSKPGSDSKNVPWHSLEQSGYYASQCASASRWINDTPNYVWRGRFYFFDWRTKIVEWFFIVVLSEFKLWTCGHGAQHLCQWRGCSTV